MRSIIKYLLPFILEWLWKKGKLEGKKLIALAEKWLDDYRNERAKEKIEKAQNKTEIDRLGKAKTQEEIDAAHSDILNS